MEAQQPLVCWEYNLPNCKFQHILCKDHDLTYYIHRSGYTVYATASGRNIGYLQSLGADQVFDYTMPSVGFEIRRATENNLKLIWDTISTTESAQICAEAFSSDGDGCRYASFLSNKSPRQDVTSIGTMLYTIWGEYFKSGDVEWPASTEDLEWMKHFLPLSEKLIKEGKIKPHRAEVRGRGLVGVIDGLEEMKNGIGGGNKLVYRVADTL